MRALAPLPVFSSPLLLLDTYDAMGIDPPPYMLNTRGGRKQYGILFIFSLFYEYSNLEYVHIHVIYRVAQAEYGIRILKEYVNTYSTCRPLTRSTPGQKGKLIISRMVVSFVLLVSGRPLVGLTVILLPFPC